MNTKPLGHGPMRSPRIASLFYPLRQFQHHPRLGYRGRYPTARYQNANTIQMIPKSRNNQLMTAYLVGCLAGIPVLWWIEPHGVEKWIQWIMLPMIAPAIAFFSTENRYVNRAFPFMVLLSAALLVFGFLAKLLG